MGTKPEKRIVNRETINLKLVLFIFYGGLACIYSTLTPHMLELGLNFGEARIVLIVAPLVAIIGPIIFGPLADRIAFKKPQQSGKYLRIIIAILMILAAIFYGILLAIPFVSRSESRRPLVSFGCDENGAVIFQERCSDEKTCFHWKNEKIGSLILTNCSYTCQNPTQFESLYNPWTKGSPIPPTVETSKERNEDYDYADYLSSSSSQERGKREIDQVYVEPPHLCTKRRNEADGKEVLDKCHVYTEDSKSLTVDATLRSATNQENETHSAEWCNYPLDGFQCHIPPQQAAWMKLYMNNTKCKPMIECEVFDPYDSPGSVLAESQCIKVIGDAELTFWSYLIIRSIGDLFVAAIVTLLNVAIIIATRETSLGRGDVGRQLAWGSFGWAIFPLIIGLAGVHGNLLAPVIVFVICMIIAAIILIASKNMPVSPPEWWWHTKSGMLAIPLSAIRKYGPEIIAVVFVALVLGIFWSVIDSYQPWHLLGLNEMDGQSVLKFSLTVAALPAMIFLWNSERFVDYCGHSNILMTAFTVYILRYTGLALIDNPWWALFMNAMEPITLSITWVTLILYMRHLMSRRFTAHGQALPVIAFFCLGKSIGAMIGLAEVNASVEELQCLYVGMAIAASIIAAIYFLLYHCLLAPRCAAQPQPLAPHTILHEEPATNGNGAGAGGGTNATTMNGNSGNYSPLRVYHNGRGRKGEFRY